LTSAVLQALLTCNVFRDFQLKSRSLPLRPTRGGHLISTLRFASTASWETVAKSLIQRVYREALGQIVEPKTKDLVADLLTYQNVQSESRALARTKTVIRRCRPRFSVADVRNSF
jgi:hypothetical protein